MSGLKPLLFYFDHVSYYSFPATLRNWPWEWVVKHAFAGKNNVGMIVKGEQYSYYMHVNLFWRTLKLIVLRGSVDRKLVGHSLPTNYSELEWLACICIVLEAYICMISWEDTKTECHNNMYLVIFTDILPQNLYFKS